MLFLWVIGCVLEERFGMGMVIVYLLGGIAAAVAQGTFKPGENQVFVGASGAVSALLGMALLAAPHARVILFYFLLITLYPRYGTFESPLWFFIPLWFFEQALMTMLTVKTEIVNVGYVAHTGGFLFGAVAGIFVNVFFVNPKGNEKS